MLKIEDLIVKFGQSPILQGVDLEVKKGEIVGLIGQNGSGKTTLLNAISGFVKSSGGSILFKDQDVTDKAPYLRAKIGIGRGFQSVGAFREMTLEENLLVALEHARNFPWWWQFSKKWRVKVDKIIDEYLESMDLVGHKKSLAGVLSGGQLRLLELLRLRISGGELILIDEPTAGVAPLMKNVLAENIRALAEDKERAIVIVEHDLKFIFELVDRVVVLVDGRIYMQGRPEELLANERLKEIYFGG